MTNNYEVKREAKRDMSDVLVEKFDYVLIEKPKTKQQFRARLIPQQSSGFILTYVSCFEDNTGMNAEAAYADITALMNINDLNVHILAVAKYLVDTKLINRVNDENLTLENLRNWVGLIWPKLMKSLAKPANFDLQLQDIYRYIIMIVNYTGNHP